MRARLIPSTTVIAEEVATQAFRHFRIESTPVVVLYRDGYVVGSAHGTAAESLDTIRRLWSASVAPQSFHPEDPRPREPEAIVAAHDRSLGILTEGEKHDYRARRR